MNESSTSSDVIYSVEQLQNKTFWETEQKGTIDLQ